MAAFGGAERRDQELFHLNALCKDRPIGTVAALQEQLQPVFTLGTFFQRDLELGDKVRPAVGIEGLPDVGADAGTGAEQLIGQHRLTAGSTDLIAEPDDGEGEGFGLVLKRAGHRQDLPKGERQLLSSSLLFLTLPKILKIREREGRVNSEEGIRKNPER